MLIVVSVILFGGIELLPGDLATQILGPSATPDRLAALRAELDLDDPVPIRYLNWIGAAVQGDLGRTATGRSVVEALGQRLDSTAALAVLALVGVSAVALGVGLLTGRRPGSRMDRALSSVTLTVVSVPEFVVAVFLVATLALGLGWVPAVSLVPAGSSALDRPEILILPALTITLVGGAFGARLVRAAVALAAAAPHVQAARLAGIPESRVLTRHVLRCAVAPIAQVLASLVPYLVAGTVVVEQVFTFPGLGSLLVDAVQQRDAPLVEGIGLLLAATAVAGFLIADVIGTIADPRTRSLRQ